MKAIIVILALALFAVPATADDTIYGSTKLSDTATEYSDLRAGDIILGNNLCSEIKKCPICGAEMVHKYKCGNSYVTYSDDMGIWPHELFFKKAKYA